MINAGKYNKKIKIIEIIDEKDKEGFAIQVEKEIFNLNASVKTTKGYTLIKNNSDFEKAYTNFTIRYSDKLDITREMLIKYNNKKYTIEYLNNVDEKNIELEIQAKEVTK